MTGNSLGERFVTVSFGESHGRCVGVVVDGCPAGLPLDEEEVQRELDLRRPGTSPVTTARTEEDRVEFLSGFFRGHTTGAPLAMLVWNKDVDSSSYEKMRGTPRPGHADYTAFVKYGGFEDYRGGGRFSARLTAGFVMAGSVAKQLIRHVWGSQVYAFTREIAGVRAPELTVEEIRGGRYSNDVRCPHPATAAVMEQKILEARRDGDSVGGLIECIAVDLPVGVGEPLFAALDSDLSKALFAIPAVKGVEFGLGFESARRRGSENNDAFKVVNGKIVTETNNSGGILGGLTSGMPLVVRIAFKPPSSIAKPQATVSVNTLKETSLAVTGRHDPCVLPRAVPVVESMVALVLADHGLRGGLIPAVLKRSATPD